MFWALLVAGVSLNTFPREIRPPGESFHALVEGNSVKMCNRILKTNPKLVLRP